MIMFQERPDDHRVVGRDAGFASQLYPLAASPPHLLPIALVFDELVVSHVHDKMAAVRQPEPNWKEKRV